MKNPTHFPRIELDNFTRMLSYQLHHCLCLTNLCAQLVRAKLLDRAVGKLLEELFVVVPLNGALRSFFLEDRDLEALFVPS